MLQIVIIYLFRQSIRTTCLIESRPRHWPSSPDPISPNAGFPGLGSAALPLLAGKHSPFEYLCVPPLQPATPTLACLRAVYYLQILLLHLCGQRVLGDMVHSLSSAN